MVESSSPNGAWSNIFIRRLFPLVLLVGENLFGISMPKDYKGVFYKGYFRPGHRGYKQKHRSHCLALANRIKESLITIEDMWELPKILHADGTIHHDYRLPAINHTHVHDRLIQIQEDIDTLISKLDK